MFVEPGSGTPSAEPPYITADLPLSSAPRGSLRLVSWPERPRLKIDLHFLTFKDPFLLEGIEKTLGLEPGGQCGGGGPRKEALLMLCKLDDSVVGPHLWGSVTSLQDARQVVGQGPGRKVFGAA